MVSRVPKPRIVKREHFYVAGYAERFDARTVGRIPALWKRFAPLMGLVPGVVTPTTYGVRFNDGDGAFDYLAGVEVSTLGSLPNGLLGLRIPRRTYAVFSHDGHVATIRETLDSIWNVWLPAAMLSVVGAASFECFGEAFDPRRGAGRFDVWVPVATLD